MTDGVDNALPDVQGEGSRQSFEELLATVRSSEVLVFPVYLDTEPEEIKRHRTPRSAYTLSRAQLAQLAEACGTQLCDVRARTKPGYYATRLGSL
jgi:hypothetical protein